MPSDNITAVLTKFAKLLNLPLTQSEIYEELLIHPEYPSLLAVSDVLTTFSIENAAYYVKADDLVNVPVPFIAHTNLYDGNFFIVHKIDNGIVLVSTEKWNRYKFSKDAFF